MIENPKSTADQVKATADQIVADAEYSCDNNDPQTIYEHAVKLHGYTLALRDAGFEEWSVERKYAINRFNDIIQLWRICRWNTRLED